MAPRFDELLELLDAEGELVNSPFNPVERSVNLVEDQTEG